MLPSTAVSVPGEVPHRTRDRRTQRGALKGNEELETCRKTLRREAAIRVGIEMVGRGDRHRKRISSDHGGDNGTREKASGNHEPGDGIEANGTIDFFGDDVFTQLRGAGGRDSDVTAAHRLQDRSHRVTIMNEIKLSGVLRRVLTNVASSTLFLRPRLGGSTSSQPRRVRTECSWQARAGWVCTMLMLAQRAVLRPGMRFNLCR